MKMVVEPFPTANASNYFSPSPMAMMGLSCGFVADEEEMGAPGGRQGQPSPSLGMAACEGAAAAPGVWRGAAVPTQWLLSTKHPEAGKTLPVEVRGFACENMDNFSALLTAC